MFTDFNYYSNKDIIYKGFSDKTINLGNRCIRELNSSGISPYDEICYLLLKNGVYYLYSGKEELGYLSNDDDGSDINFKKFINSAFNDLGSFYCIVFPCYIDWYPFSNKYVVYKTEESFKGIYKSIG